MCLVHSPLQARQVYGTLQGYCGKSLRRMRAAVKRAWKKNTKPQAPAAEVKLGYLQVNMCYP